MQHFHEKLQAEHGIELSYTWVKQALQGPGLVARGRSERNFGTWQGRLPQELRLRELGTLEAANRFLREVGTKQFTSMRWISTNCLI